MGLFDASSFNCSKTGKFFNTGVAIASLGMVSGPSSKQCDEFYNPPSKSTPNNYYDEIKKFVQENSLVIAVIIVALIYLKKK